VANRTIWMCQFTAINTVSVIVTVFCVLSLVLQTLWFMSARLTIRIRNFGYERSCRSKDTDTSLK